MKIYITSYKSAKMIFLIQTKLRQIKLGRLWHFNDICITVVLDQKQRREDLSSAVIMPAVL